jgi:NAD(P)H-dependent FMN reductase
VKISIVSGSHRKGSQSGKVAQFVERLVKTEYVAAFDSVYALDLGTSPLPFWDEDLQRTDPPDSRWKEIWSPVSAAFENSHAFILITPEWSGMVPAALKNLLLLCTNNELMHKPALIISLSSGLGGAYPVMELRGNTSKDTKVCYIPESVIIRQVQSVLNHGEPQNDYDRSTRARLRYCISLLREYAKALITVRESGAVDPINFPFGM